jgi:DNA-binding transcriptional MerR regulator
VDHGRYPRWVPEMAAHGRLSAADVGALVGVSGTTVGQWARRGYIDSSQRRREPRVYAVEDVVEAAIVRALLDRGLRRPEVRRAIARLREDGPPWPLSRMRLGTVTDSGRTRLLVHADGGWQELTPRGWQRVVALRGVDEVPLRLPATP